MCALLILSIINYTFFVLVSNKRYEGIWSSPPSQSGLLPRRSDKCRVFSFLSVAAAAALQSLTGYHKEHGYTNRIPRSNSKCPLKSRRPSIVSGPFFRTLAVASHPSIKRNAVTTVRFLFIFSLFIFHFFSPSHFIRNYF